MTSHRALDEQEWLWGWDSTPGIVSVWVESDGFATVWQRNGETAQLTRTVVPFRPWILLRDLLDLRDGGVPVGADGDATARVQVRNLKGAGELRYVVSAPTQAELTAALLRGASARLAREVRHVRDLGNDHLLMLAPEEQYLVASGRNYFRDLTFEQLHRLQFDLETTGLDANQHRIFMIAVRHANGELQTLEAQDDSDNAERRLIQQLAEVVRASDPDVIENHNLHGFDLPFLHTRARKLRMPFALGRTSHKILLTRGSRRGAPSEYDADRRVRFVAPGRELIDTLDAVRFYDFSARELPSHGLKAVARHLGFAGPDREYIRGDQIYATYKRDPDRVRRYATDDVIEVAKLAEMLGGAAFALARMAPRRYERLADAGAATGVIDPMLVRAYLRSGVALPAHQPGDGTVHTGAALYLFATGVAHRVVKADVASLYPSLMRQYKIGPRRDELGAMLALVNQLVEQRLDAKAQSRRAPPGSADRHTHEAMSAAMKLVVNSAYGYLGAGGGLTRFADVHAANQVTRRGRETLALMCRELALRGVTLLEGDTDGVYFAVPAAWTEAEERRVVAEVASLLPPLVQLEFEGRYAAMLSHEPKNYALLTDSGELILRGVAFRSSRAEPFGEKFLRRAIRKLLQGDVAGVRDEYVRVVSALRTRNMPTFDVSSKVRLTKSAEQYNEVRASRRELSYEAMLASGRTGWRVGERARVYRTQGGAGIVVEAEEGGRALGDAEGVVDARDYDAEYYVRLLKDSFAARLERAFAPADFDTVFADPVQPSLFTATIGDIVPVLEPIDAVPSEADVLNTR
ncbi:MAG: ribonuclease H-like domain-containing protein [Phycisphaerae bacterium]|nr:ribonuclease H-like domain-containing protein [Gemmatimonadaceae bacterium]